MPIPHTVGSCAIVLSNDLRAAAPFWEHSLLLSDPAVDGVVGLGGLCIELEAVQEPRCAADPLIRISAIEGGCLQ